jgi:hypothetical protein
MSDFTMDLNTINKLSASISALREARNNPLVSDKIEILITWKDHNDDNDDSDNNTHKITVFAGMPNIWVTGFQSKSGAKIDFSIQDKGEKYIGYDNVSCPLTLDNIRQNLKPLELVKSESDFISKRNTLKTAIVMCIFITSEIIRNELLEKIVRNQSHSNVGSYVYNWGEMMDIYQNWASDSKLIYEKDSDVIHTILLRDVKDELIKLKKLNDTSCGFYRRYHDLVEVIDSY